jgi:hypothetical protein
MNIQCEQRGCNATVQFLFAVTVDPLFRKAGFVVYVTHSMFFNERRLYIYTAYLAYSQHHFPEDDIELFSF